MSIDLHPARRGRALALLLALGAAGCQPAAPASSPAPAPAAAALPSDAVLLPVAPAANLRSFPSADSLAGYLRAGSAAGPLISAHRGGPVDRYPENAIVTFERTLSLTPALLEIDVRHTRDGALVLLHDETLERTTNGAGPLAARTLAEVRALRLRDPMGRLTPHAIPTLDETLAWSEGRAVLLLDVKRGVAPDTLVAAVRRAGAADRVVVIVYTHDDLLLYHRLAPELVISFSAETPADVERAVAAGVDPRRLIAFTGVGELRPETYEALHARGIRAQLGTFGPIDARAAAEGAQVYRALLERGVEVISTDSVSRAAGVVR
ncbi:MAG TPA: glycerophosphodiester phosphodiesterase family protein [Gemmatimonadaceae bacterium]|nr:glycerophosphodiester phosphodiesterase family protein [Gemmatimonadaceae bacterium]